MDPVWRGMFPPFGNSELYTFHSKALVSMSVIAPYMIKTNPKSILKQLHIILDPQQCCAQSLCDFDGRVHTPANDVNNQWLSGLQTMRASYDSTISGSFQIITPILYTRKDSERVSKGSGWRRRWGTELRRGLAPVAAGFMLRLYYTDSYLRLTCYTFSYFSLWLSHSHEQNKHLVRAKDMHCNILSTKSTWRGEKWALCLANIVKI